MRCFTLMLLLTVLALALLAPTAVAASPRAEIAALQVALRSAGLYSGTVDGIAGPDTAAAVRAAQRNAGLSIDGVAGPVTRRALGRLGRPDFGSRTIVAGAVGWDVSALQFSLAIHGFPGGPFDGALGARSVTALQRFQRWSGLAADGAAGPSTLRALSAAPPRSPVRLRYPVRAAAGNGFGPRSNVFHSGVDFPAPSGTPVTAAGFGTVLAARFAASGWGNMVVVGHRFGLRTLYAHLASINVVAGQFVAVGQRLGTVGATGRTSGPHLHFEVLLRGANVDPLSAL
jgi:murein DD-endopeptidase MepM/ murein hydrolase activator NlpD